MTKDSSKAPQENDNTVKENVSTQQPEQQIQPVQYVDSNGNPVQNVQYVVQEKSLKGVGGWLIFWLIYLGLTAIYGLIATFIYLAALAEGNASGTTFAILIQSVIFTPILCATAIMSVIFISMQKKLGKIMAWVTFGISALYATIVSITAMFTQVCRTVRTGGWFGQTETVCEGIGAGGIIMLFGAIVVSIVIAGLCSLYFWKSKRVALTLVK